MHNTENYECLLPCRFQHKNNYHIVMKFGILGLTIKIVKQD